MSRIDTRDLVRFRNQLTRLKNGMDYFIADCAKELAARLIAAVKRRTPVKTGNLRRNWTTTGTTKHGMTYTIQVINATEYALYVEYGHRTAHHTGWVPGKFMLTLSSDEIQRNAQSILEARIRRKFGEYFR